MLVEIFDFKKVVNKIMILEILVKVFNEIKLSISIVGNRIGFVSFGCFKNFVDFE